MVACRYGIALLVFILTSHSFAALTCELSSRTLANKFHIHARPCTIFYLFFFVYKLILRPKTNFSTILAFEEANIELIT